MVCKHGEISIFCSFCDATYVRKMDQLQALKNKVKVSDLDGESRFMTKPLRKDVV